MPALDIDFIRSQFPAFSEGSLEGQAFFENAGGSYACGQVIDRLTRYYRETKVQPYWTFAASAKAGAQMDEAYARIAGLMNVTADEVNFGPSTSQNTYVLANAFRPLWADGDEIIVTNQDHEANTGAWRRLADRGIVVREWQVNPETGQLDLADLDTLLNNKTRLVTFPHCSNIVAHINPVREIADKAHSVGAHVVVDGVSYAPHGLPDVEALGADVYLCSLYKVYGPHLGLMVVRRALLDALANQSHFFNADVPHAKLTPAGPDHAQIAAAGGVADYFDTVHAHHFGDEPNAPTRGRQVHDLFRAQEQALLEPVLEYFRSRNDVRLMGPSDAAVRAPTVAVHTLNRNPHEIAEDLAPKGIMAGAGDFYSVRVIDAMGVKPDPGVLRVSFVHYTTRHEVDRLIAALDETLG
ncbi:MAG: aminotransferase class V-fold PLP-dependent enzyme [Alphaproteobacteria bacterium]|nr:aminotransferase class V-fold PLP-dependent enzyme [Alphaproteobacteria bacterium]